MQHLSKENFWNALKDEYPEAVDHFRKWIDEYKKEVDWDALFPRRYKDPRITDQVKFHDLPFEMQNGIIARFELEMFNNTNGIGKEVYKELAALYRSQIRKLFEDLQGNITKSKIKLN